MFGYKSSSTSKTGTTRWSIVQVSNLWYFPKVQKCFSSIETSQALFSSKQVMVLYKVWDRYENELSVWQEKIIVSAKYKVAI